MTAINEFFWPDGERPGWAIRWSVTRIEAHAEVCAASTASYTDGRPDEDIVMSDGSNDVPLDGPWVAEFSVTIKFDGWARMWAEDLQLGWANGISDLVPLFDYLYRRGVELIAERQG